MLRNLCRIEENVTFYIKKKHENSAKEKKNVVN
jgi:hypothetical protein